MSVDVSLVMDEVDAPATVLCVDDEQNILSALKRLFRPQGYRILTAMNGVEGLKVLENESVDLVISDMRMPEMDGATFLAQVAQFWPKTVRILLTGYADIGSTIAAVNDGGIYRYVSKPWEDSDLVLAVRNGLERKMLELERDRLLDLTRQQNDELKELNAGLEMKVAQRTEEVRQTMAFVEQAHSDLKGSYAAAVKVFSNLLDTRAKSMAGHSRRVAEHARSLAIKIGMSESDVETVVFAALLHDIGKIGLPDQVISKPQQLLTPTELDQVMQHPAVGAAVLMGVDYLQGAAQLVRSHHERYDGQGYPDRLMGDDIPLGARILAVVNDYDSVQRGGLAQVRCNAIHAADFLNEHRGTRYDPELVHAFLSLRGYDGKEDGAHEADRSITSGALLEGMVLSRDLTTRDGILLLSSGFVLDGKTIEKIRQFERAVNYELAVYVEDERLGVS